MLPMTTRLYVAAALFVLTAGAAFAAYLLQNEPLAAYLGGIGTAIFGIVGDLLRAGHIKRSQPPPAPDMPPEREDTHPFETQGGDPKNTDNVTTLRPGQ